MKTVQAFLLLVTLISTAAADDFKTTTGQEYKNVTISHIDPDGIVISASYGIIKIPFTELPAEVQKKYGYDAKAAATFRQQTYDANVTRAQQLEAAKEKRRQELASSITDTQRTEAAAKIRAEIDRLKLYMMDGQISQVMRDGVILRGPTWEQNGSKLKPVAWINCLLVGEFPGAVDGATWTGWMWPAGTYTDGVQTIQRYATTLDDAWQLQIKEAAGRLQKH